MRSSLSRRPRLRRATTLSIASGTFARRLNCPQVSSSRSVVQREIYARRPDRSADVRPRRTGLQPPRSTSAGCSPLHAGRTGRRRNRVCAILGRHDHEQDLADTLDLYRDRRIRRPCNALHPRLQPVVVGHADDLSSIGYADQQHPTTGVSERAQLSAEIPRQRALELDRGTFALGDEFRDVFSLHTAMSPLIRRGRSRSRAWASALLWRASFLHCSDHHRRIGFLQHGAESPKAVSSQVEDGECLSH